MSVRLWWHRHGRAAGRAMAHLRAAPFVTLATAVGLAVLLVLPALLFRLSLVVAELAASPATRPQLSVFMAIDATRKQAKDLAEELARRPESLHVELIPREETLARYRQKKGYAEALAALAENPYPDALIVIPREVEAKVIEALARELRASPGVERVEVDAGWARKLDSLARGARILAALFVALFAVALTTIAFNATRVAALGRREEITVAHLLGASSAFIRRPFLWQGTFVGILGGSFGALLYLVVQAALEPWLVELAHSFSIALPPLSWEWVSAVLIGVSSALGWLGAAVALVRLPR